MNRRIAQTAKTALVRFGSALSPLAFRLLDSTYSYLAVGQWLRTQELPIRTYATREALFEEIAGEVRGENVLYLEFGVYEGASMRTWSTLLAGQHASLHGFDSFEGLPDTWNAANPAGHFSTQGRVPDVMDDRITFFAGWFSDTLASYEAPAHDRLIINFDADLYASTKCVLDHLEPLIVPGTYLYFDEFANHDHELRAFQEYVKRTDLRLRLIGATPDLQHVAFQVLESATRSGRNRI